VIELTEKEKRFLKRVDTISHFPWSNKVSAVDAKGKSMRISRATFARLRDDGIIVRSASDLSSDTYGCQFLSCDAGRRGGAGGIRSGLRPTVKLYAASFSRQ
jgi:hypothetical protein